MADEKSRPRIVIIGLGETGILTATRLSRSADIVAIATKPCLVSGQELGTRLTAPDAWKREYLIGFGQFRHLDGVKIIEARAVSLDVAAQSLAIEHLGGAHEAINYDILVIASGISNGFWRDDAFRDRAEIEADLTRNAATLAKAQTIAVVGGGPSGVSTAVNLAATYTDKAVHLFHAGDAPLPGYHPDTRTSVVAQLAVKGVKLHPHHRAILPGEERMRAIDSGEIIWESGEPRFVADAIIWATGAARPNSGFLPADMLDAKGYVLTDPTLHAQGHTNIFAIGDVAATDPHRSSARNWAYRILAHNINALLSDKPLKLKRFEAPPYRWGSIIGLQANGLTIHQADGKIMRLSRWIVRNLLYPIAVHRVIYRGVRR